MIWKEQPLIGFGLKSFRIKCWEVGPKNRHLQPQSKISIFSCSNHPHNYYFELLSETGIVGAILMLMFFIKSVNSPISKVPNLSKVLNAIALTCAEIESSNFPFIGFNSSLIFLSIQS